MNVAFFFHCKINCPSQNQKKIYFQMLVIHFNEKTLKALLLQIQETKMIVSSKVGGINFIPSTCGQKLTYMDMNLRLSEIFIIFCQVQKTYIKV